MLLAVYAYVRKVVNNRARNEIEDEDKFAGNNAIPTSMAATELQIRTINAINNLIKRNDEFEVQVNSKLQQFTSKVDRRSIQIQDIA